jgi:hypothetical protein
MIDDVNILEEYINIIWLCLANRTQGKIMIKVANKLFENVIKFKYLRTTVTIKITFTKKLRVEQIERERVVPLGS